MTISGQTSINNFPSNKISHQNSRQSISQVSKHGPSRTVYSVMRPTRAVYQSVNRKVVSPQKEALNSTIRSKESGTNVSYQSNYSAIQSNILRFKNGGLSTPTKKINVPNSIKKSGMKGMSSINNSRVSSVVRN